MNEGGQARRDQTQASSTTQHGQQLTPDSETQRSSELDDENTLAGHLRPHLVAVHQRLCLWRFGRLAADALRSPVNIGHDLAQAVAMHPSLERTTVAIGWTLQPTDEPLSRLLLHTRRRWCWVQAR